MERIDYPEIIEKILNRHTGNDLEEQTEIQVVIDRERHHYQILNIGWIDEEQVRVHACVIHIDIKDDKIWIQRDGTEVGIANELIEMGVPKEDIVFAFHAPYKRKLIQSS